MTRAVLASQIVAASRSLHARGWVANHDGNVSARWTEGRFLVTPTATSKADASEGGLAVTDAEGTPVEGDTKPPSEFALHLGAFRVRPDVGAVVHAHPPYATAMACAGKAIEVFLPEAIVSIGVRVPLSRFALPFGAEGSAVVEELVDRYDAILLCRHGVITVGRDVEQAMLRMELVEHLARIQTLAIPHGGVQPLAAEVIELLLGKRRKAAPTLGAAAALGGAVDPPLAPPLAPPLDPTSWTPAGPPPAADAWSGGRSEGACGIVYGSPGALSESATAPPADDLAAAIRDEVAKHLG
jgi:L-fuculose-phosphate aldolase